MLPFQTVAPELPNISTHRLGGFLETKSLNLVIPPETRQIKKIRTKRLIAFT